MNSNQPVHAQIRRFHQHAQPPTTIRATRFHAAHGHQPFRPLPAPTGKPPYHLSLADVLPPDAMTAITTAGRLVFHLVGDTGGIKNPDPQQRVAERMERDFGVADVAARPSFFFHLGDVVYFYGEATEYFPQFYEPYQEYPGPIFAIPGNHDGDLSKAMEDQGVDSLDAFVANFCTPVAHHTREALDAPRYAMTQPNVYWTLDTPYATIVGLYTNVPEGGQLDDYQVQWLDQELSTAATDRALLLAMHHPIYSVDDYHTGSMYMETVLNEAMQRTGRIPDAVLAGHVHNYQRFTRQIEGRAVPFIVAGGGGYHNLHTVSQSVKGAGQQPPVAVQGADGVTMETYCDDQYGYLLMDLTSKQLRGRYYRVSKYPGSADEPDAPFDTFTLDLQAHRVTTG